MQNFWFVTIAAEGRAATRLAPSADHEEPMAEPMEQDNLIELTAEIVSAYVSTNNIASGDLPSLINQVHSRAASHRDRRGRAGAGAAEAGRRGEEVRDAGLHRLPGGREEVQVAEAAPSHALRPDAGGVPGRSGVLPADYPMVAPNYAKARSALAKEMGLGQKRGVTQRRAAQCSPCVAFNSRRRSVSARYAWRSAMWRLRS